MNAKIKPFFIDGLKQNPKSRDFNITPSLVFASASSEELDHKGYAYSIGIKFCFLALGLHLLVKK